MANISTYERKLHGLTLLPSKTTMYREKASTGTYIHVRVSIPVSIFYPYDKLL